jgi:heat shock protein HtpX
MPYSFTAIERRKSLTIQYVFAFMFLFYFLVTLGVYAFGKWSILFYQYCFRPAAAASLEVSLINGPPVIPFHFFLTFLELFTVGFLAFAVAWWHWAYTAEHMFERILNVLKAQLIKTDDPYHKTFQNILEELSVATGGRQFQGYVLPTTAMNAFALEDFEGNAVIGLTEGLLSKLTRAQIEAVVAHEAGHVLRGDSLETTLTISLYRLLQEILRNYQNLLAGMLAPQEDGYEYRFVLRPTLAVVYFYIMSLVVMGFLQATNLIGLMLNMFLSRQREFRADAIAVRLSRDPLSLAEALYIISHRWRGAGLPGENLDAIFIVSPQYNNLAETEGLVSDLFSTHPPVEHRISILLDMAHADVDVLERALARIVSASPIEPPKAVSPRPVNKWFLLHNDKWEGPFSLAEMATMNWLTPLLLVKKVGTDKTVSAYEDLQVNQVLKLQQKSSGEQKNCPKCHIPLLAQEYEGVTILQCPNCAGVLVEEADVQRILVRQEKAFADHIKYLAEISKQQDLKRHKYADVNIYSDDGLVCPHCQHARARMIRQFFNLLYKIEIDKCQFCGRIWFDKDELEMFQYLYEQENNAKERKDS